MLENQGLLGIALFEATALIILLVLFVLLRKDHSSRYFRLWTVGWFALTLSALGEILLVFQPSESLRLTVVVCHFTAFLLFLGAALAYTSERKSNWPLGPLAFLLVLLVCYGERGGAVSHGYGLVHWSTSQAESVLCFLAGWPLWRHRERVRGFGARLLAGAFLVSGLHGMDRPLWPGSPLFLLRIAFDHLLCVTLGISMVVLVLERAHTRTEELNDKLRRLTMLTAASTQTLSVREVLDRVLSHLVASVNASHGIVRLIEGSGKNAELVMRASVGYSDDFIKKYNRLPVNDSWRVLKEHCVFTCYDDELDPQVRGRMEQAGVRDLVTLVLPGKEGPLGIIALGSARSLRFQPDEVSYLLNIANFLGLTLQNVGLLEELSSIQRQWAYTFDSIGDAILVHDNDYRLIRWNRRLEQITGREGAALAGRGLHEVLTSRQAQFEHCPYCEGLAGEGDDPDPWLHGYFLASNSTFADPAGRQLGIVHILKDITDRKRVEEKYRSLIANVQEGVFISTPTGRFLDFNDAFLRIAGYDSREELLATEIPNLYASQSDRDRLKKLLNEHGAVADFEFEMRRKDGELRTVLESSVAVRDAAGNVTAYQGFLLDITERKHAEREIRRRNRELMVLNSIAQTLSESMDLNDSIHRTLRQMTELFHLDATSLYLLDKGGETIRRIAAVGHRSEYASHFPPSKVHPELIQHLQSVHATFVSVQGMPLPQVLRDVQRKEGIASAYLVVLWSKDRVMGGLVVGNRTPREFSPADVHLLTAVGSQIASAIERTLLYEETRQAYNNLQRTQQQLLHSEKMAAIGQLISGVAHELNNPLTAILGYSQLLTSSGQLGPQGLEYTDKLHKQAQRTHRIVQNLLSFARQHKPERASVQLNDLLGETLALRDYDLRMSNIRVHLDLAQDLPATAADPHQLQQVFLNLINNAVDAILEKASDGDLWVRSHALGAKIILEIEDSGTGIQDPSKVFDPFYTTKPVGKGTGLGLSICYGIITEHGGTIRAQNVAGGGARFSIELPVQAIAAVAERVRDAEPENARPGRVLLLDEDASVLEAAEAILRGREHRVHAAHTEREALALLRAHEFDVIVADLPVSGNGHGSTDLRRLLAQRPGLADRVVLMAASAAAAQQATASQIRPVAVLEKPFKSDDLLSTVDKVLSSVHAAAIR